MTKTAKHRDIVRTLEVAVLLGVILYFGQTLFIPLCYGMLIAFVLYPLCKRLELRKWPRGVAISIALFGVFIFFFLLVLVLGLQLTAFRKDLPVLIDKLQPALSDFRNWLAVNLGFSIEWQNEAWTEAAHSLTSNAGKILSSTLSATAGAMVSLFLIPVYAALFLYNRHTFVLFLQKVIGESRITELQATLSAIIHTYYNFIKGMVFVYVIVGILNSIGLLALGINHAILFGMLTALMTIIPYVGIILSALLPISVAIATKDSLWYSFGVVAVFAFVQYLEANVIFPRVVGSQLKLSTWASLIAIIAGGLFWGVSGMILFLPMCAILMVATEHIPLLAPLHILLRRDNPETVDYHPQNK